MPTTFDDYQKEIKAKRLKRKARFLSALRKLPEDYKTIARETGSNLKSFARAFPRAAYSVGASAGEEISKKILGRQLTDQERELKAQNRVQRFLFGEEPVRTISLGRERTEKFGEAIGLSKKLSRFLSAPIVFGGLALDLIPGIGGAEKKVAQKAFTEIATTKELPQIVKLLKTVIEGSDESIEQTARQLVDIDDPKKVEELVTSFTKQAQKYNTREEFVKAKETNLILRGTKNLTEADITKTLPNIKLKAGVQATDLAGNKVTIPKGEKLTPYELKGNKVLLQDGQPYLVNKNQFQNIKGNSISAEGKPFAPELEGLEETVKGTQKVAIRDKAYADFDAGKITREQRNAIIDKLGVPNETKYSQYTLPNGENYREVLIKAPLKERPVEFVDFVREHTLYKSVEEMPPRVRELVMEDWNRFDKRLTTYGAFKSSHWDEANVISHLRLNERTYKGKKVTFMEELQSDWAREGRAKGFAKAQPEFSVRQKTNRKWEIVDNEGNILDDGVTTEYNTKQIAEQKMLSEFGKPKQIAGIPNNPNLKNWQELSIKRALQDAVDNKSDYFAWINGEQTSARYNLATHIDDVNWKHATSLREGESYKRIKLNIKGGDAKVITLDNKTGKIVEKDSSIPSDWIGKKLDEVLGKGLADKIMAQESGTLSGEGLKFGGEWATNLYDKQVKNIVEDLTGQKVEMLDLGLPIEKVDKYDISKLRDGDTIKINGGEPVKVEKALKTFYADGIEFTANDIATGKYKIEIIKGQLFPTTQQQGIKLTPEVKAKIQGKALDIKTSGKMYEDRTTQLTDDFLEEAIKRDQDIISKQSSTITNNLAQTPDGQILKESERERGYITSIKESPDFSEQLKQEIGDVTYDPKTNSILFEQATKRIDASFEEAKKFAYSNNTDEAVATRILIEKNLAKQFEQTTEKEAKSSIAKDFFDRIKENARLGTEAGRSVQAYNLLQKQTPEGFLRQVIRETELFNKKATTKVEITPEKFEKYLDKAIDVSRMPDGESKQIATKDFFEDFRKELPSPLWKRIVNFWKAGLLTGIKTSGLNIASTFMGGVSEIIKDIPAVGLDMLIALKTGKRSRVFTLKGVRGSFSRGIKDGWKMVKTGVDPDIDILKQDIYKINYPDTRIGQAMKSYTETIFNIIGAEDKSFFEAARTKSLASQAKVEIINNKLKFTDRKAKNDFIENFIKNPSDEALQLATEDAKIATYKNDTLLGKMAESAKGTAASFGAFPGALVESVIPFSKTPAAFASLMIDYSPVGLVKTIISNIGKGKFNQKAFVEGIGRSITGTGVLAIGVALAKKGLITTGYPTDEKTRKEWELKGITPNSIKIGNKYIPFAYLGPLGMVLAGGAYYQKGLEETGSPTAAALEASIGGLKAVTEQPFLTGIQNIMGALQAPDQKGQAILDSYARSLFPTFFRDVATGIDPYQRDTKGIKNAFLGSIPGLRQTLPERRDVLGQPLKRNRTALGQSISPLRASNIQDNPVYDEILRLKNEGFDVRPGALDKKIQGIRLNKDEFDQYQSVWGDIVVPVLEDIQNSQIYLEASDEEKSKMIDKIFTKVREKLREKVFPSIVIEKYNLPNDIEPKIIYEIIKKINSKNKDFKNLGDELQGNIIRNIIDNL